MKEKTPKRQRRNPVARYAVRLLKSGVMLDKTKYRRHTKHKSRDSYTVAVVFSC